MARKMSFAAFIQRADIAKYRNTVEPFSVINNWMRSKSTIDFIGLWEKIDNPGFKPIEFQRFRNEAGNDPNPARFTAKQTLATA